MLVNMTATSNFSQLAVWLPLPAQPQSVQHVECNSGIFSYATACTSPGYCCCCLLLLLLLAIVTVKPTTAHIIHINNNNYNNNNYYYSATIPDLRMSCSWFKPEHRAEMGCHSGEQMLGLGEGTLGYTFISETRDDAEFPHVWLMSPHFTVAEQHRAGAPQPQLWSCRMLGL